MQRRTNIHGKEWLEISKKPKKTENEDAGLRMQIAEKAE